MKNKENGITLVAMIITIVLVIAVISIAHKADVPPVDDNTISTKDIRYIISTFDSNVRSVEDNYISQKDGNNRTFAIFTYKTYSSNLDEQTVYVMFMKKILMRLKFHF